MRAYYPSLLPNFERVLAHRDYLNSVVEDHKEKYRNGINIGSESLERIWPRLNELIEDSKQFELEIAEYARNKESLRDEGE